MESQSKTQDPSSSDVVSQESTSARPSVTQDSVVEDPDSSTASSAEDDLFLYETQHFGFTPTGLINGMYNTIVDFFSDALKAFANALHEKYPTVQTTQELAAARHRVGLKTDKDICTVVDNLEHFLLANIFSIPDNVVLGEDQCQLERLTSAEEQELQRKKDEVKRRILAVKYANAVLSQRIEQTNRLQADVDAVLNGLSSQHLAQHDAEAVSDWTSYHSEVLSRVNDQL